MADLDDVLTALKANADSLPGQIQMLETELKELRTELQALTASAAPNSGITDIKKAVNQLGQEAAAWLLKLNASAEGDDPNPAPGLRAPSARAVQTDKILANTNNVIAEPSKVIPFDSKIVGPADKVLQPQKNR